MSIQNSENPDNDNMAGSYVVALKQNNNFSKGNAELDAEYFNIKPVFILESDIFGSSKPDKNNSLTHTELFRCIDLTIPDNHLNRPQRVLGGVWRIYPDNEEDRDTLVANTVRKKRIEVYPRNQKYVEKESPTTVRIRMKNIPLSADDDQLLRYLQNWHLNVLNYHRKRLRIDGLVKNCQTAMIGNACGANGHISKNCTSEFDKNCQSVSEDSTEESDEENENEPEKDEEIVPYQSTENILHTDDTPHNEQTSKINELTKFTSKVDVPKQNLYLIRSQRVT
ncbi:Hypothetical predicted protein [Mytilus galloprovincialis]|uniref:CCHC-type domain-containing protein n=1 Tax=Mytilus galloprovincialis TaxID=29158 RepID=A0A8B6G8W2_MYTGA|nr:Hypothetical predicted protein [Mytilus galloprovincialis]